MKGQSRRQNISKVQKDSVFSRRTAVAVLAVLLICAFFTGMNLLHSQAQEKTSPYHKYYTSIRIQEGDSLWSIEFKQQIKGVDRKQRVWIANEGCE